MTMVTKTCREPECSNTFEVEIPDDLPEKRREMLIRFPLLCDDCGERNDEAEAERQRELARDAYLDRVKASGLGSNLIGLSIETVRPREHQAEAFKDVVRWANRDIRGLILGGPVGVGKSYLAASAANKRLLGEHLDWITVPRLMVQMRAGFKDPAREQVTKLLLSGRRTLVLDDIDKAKPTDHAKEVLFEAIESRTSNGASLLITTNMHYPELKEHLGEAIASRIAGYCAAHFIEGEDLRAAA